MTQPSMQISGGAGGTEAHYEDLASLARNSDDLAGALAAVTVKCHGILAAPDVLASAVLDPGGVAAFEKTLLAALDGRHGVTALAGRYGARAVSLRAAAAAYQATDAASGALVDRVRWAAGYFAGEHPVLAAGGLLLAGSVTLGGAFVLDPVGTASALSDPQRFLTDHPGILDNVVGASPGLISGLTGLPVGDVGTGAHLLGALYPDGTPQVTEDGRDNTAAATNAPAGFGDLMNSLDYRNNKAHGDNDDEIDVRVVTKPDGTKSYIVDIPGTKDWNNPGQFNPDSNDLGTNVHVLGGDTTSREKAIADALRRSGASSTDPVMLIGHSQGGMVAAQAAADTGNGAFNYNVTHVVTAGSPIARADVPGHVQVLSLENSHDLVPHLDARDNPDRPNWTTVRFDHQLGTAGENHSTTTSYLPAARQLDQSTDPSVVAFRNSAGSFLSTPASGTTVQADVYHLHRQG
ncbi:alpha/beta hydrolase [Krasilnikovia sp. M28-CT-15]|uniref:PGAP1-like alpha/beta domain-containing protein n=1 Tax=Krasilnikovia sp. M28-CT-15 TaxID=3373540 RepID=UPI003876F797